MANAIVPHADTKPQMLGPKILASDPSPTDEALYIVSVSPSYAINVYEENYGRAMPGGLNVGDMNFLSPQHDLFRIGYVMSSAGQAFRQKKHCIITERDRAATSLICDSGGYAIAKQTAGIDGHEHRAMILGWMQDHADFAMTLDVPVGPVGKPDYPYKSIKQCLDTTLEHLRYFEQKRDKNSQVCWLNVVQARSPAGGYAWYDAVKHFDFCNGWAIAGAQRKNFNYVLSLILRMLEDGNLQQKRHIHMLGTAELPIACMLTALQRELNQNGCNLRITYDTASPFKMMAMGNVYTLPNFTADTLKLSALSAPRSFGCVTSNLDWPWPSPLGNRLQLKDVCVQHNGRSGYYFDKLSYDILAHHNIAALCAGVKMANRVMDAQRTDGVPKLALKLDRAIGAIKTVFKSGGSHDVLAAHSHIFNDLARGSFPLAQTEPDERDEVDPFGVV